MGKISPVSYKYIINATFEVDGIVDKPDAIGAIFGQTEGLLGEELELRELQQSGKIGRIEVNLDTKAGKTYGSIVIPSSMDKAETALIAAALEIIQRIGPCNAKVKAVSIEDVRISKRNYVLERAKVLLKALTEKTADSAELVNELIKTLRVAECISYGRERLPAGPAIDESAEIIVVEGRADVLNLLKHGFKAVIAMNGTSCPETIKELSKKKEVTAFVDGDRGGDLIARELLSVADIDYIARAPDGKEVEELTKKEILKALRAKVAVSQEEKLKAGIESKKKLSELLESLLGSKAAAFVDSEYRLLKKIPGSELTRALAELREPVHTIVIDGLLTKEICEAAEKAGVRQVVARESEVKEFGRLGIVII